MNVQEWRSEKIYATGVKTSKFAEVCLTTYSQVAGTKLTKWLLLSQQLS